MNNAARYTDPDVFQAERDNIFADKWQIVGDLAALREPGDYVCANLAGFAAFVMRDEKGGLRALRNVCRHQQLPVLDNGIGHCDGKVRCRYHGWTYDLTGKCILAPPQVRPDDFETGEYRLDRVHFAKWRGLVAVNFADDAAPIASAFADIDVEDTSTSFLHRDVVRVFANWKAIVDEIVAGKYRPLPDAEAIRRVDTGVARRKGSEQWRWHAPTLSLHTSGRALLVLQVVPRTFLKSEIHWYLFGEQGTVLTEIGARAAEQFAKAAEARQEHIKTQDELPPLADPAAAAFVHELLTTN